MWGQHTKSIKYKIIILVALSVAFVPVSYYWHEALSNFECKVSKSGEPSDIKFNAKEVQDACNQQITTHWILFLGVNCIAYGGPIIMILKVSRKSRPFID